MSNCCRNVMSDWYSEISASIQAENTAARIQSAVSHWAGKAAVQCQLIYFFPESLPQVGIQASVMLHSNPPKVKNSTFIIFLQACFGSLTDENSRRPDRVPAVCWAPVDQSLIFRYSASTAAAVSLSEGMPLNCSKAFLIPREAINCCISELCTSSGLL